MINENRPTLAKFLKNCVARIDRIGLPVEEAARNYVDNIEEFLEAVEANLSEFNELAWRALSSDQV